MSTKDKTNLETQEIDLAVISNKIAGFFQSISTGIFKFIQFLIKNIVILGILFVIGFGLGLYLDRTNKIYDHEIIAQPNFGSTDYMYSKVELLASKIRQRDTVFLKAIGIDKPSNLLKIKIEPVIDIYKFISSGDKDSNEQNFELLKLIAEDGDMKKIIEEKTTSKNYAFHLISFTTNKISNRKDIIEPLLKYLNNSTFFNQIQNVYIKNTQTKITRNNEIIAQIDGFLNTYAKEGATSKSSTTINIQNTQSINGKLKLVLPILFIALYMMIYFFISFYKKQSAKNK